MQGQTFGERPSAGLQPEDLGVSQMRDPPMVRKRSSSNLVKGSPKTPDSRTLVLCRRGKKFLWIGGGTVEHRNLPLVIDYSDIIEL